MPKIKKDKNKNFAIEDVNINNDIMGENGGKNDDDNEEVASSIEETAAQVAPPIEEEQILPDIEEKPPTKTN